MKIVKWFFIVLFLMFASLAAYLTLVFDPNDFKPEIVNAVKKQTGRELIIGKDLTWTFFPSIGIELGDITLSNPKGFDNDSMLKVNKIVAQVELLPLFSKQVEIAKLNLDGLVVNLETRKDGRTSFDGLQSSAAEDKPAQLNDTTASSGNLSSLDIGGVSITNTQIRVSDKQAGTEQVFSLDNLTLGKFSLGEFATLEYRFSAEMPDMTLMSQGKGSIRVAQDMTKVQVKDFKITNEVAGEGIPNKQLDISLLTQLEILLETKQIHLILDELNAGDIQAKGKLDIAYGHKVPQIIAKLDLGDIDLDKLLPQTDKADKTKEKSQAEATQVEPDLSAMKSLDLTLALTAKSIKASNMMTSNWIMAMTLKNGILNLKQLNADLYGGKLAVTASLDGRQAVPSYSFEKSVTGVQVRELLKDAVDVDLLAGTANFSVKGKGRSLLADNIKKNIAAKGKFEIADGALYGVNIPQMIREAQAKLSGGGSSTSSSEKKTDFTSLTGSFSVVKGVVSNPDLLMSSPLIRLSGAGTANIISEALDYQLTTAVVGSLEGQGGGDTDLLYGIEIPFLITGTMSDPQFALDTAGLFDAKLKQEVEKVQDKLKDSLLKKLGGF
ncbi:AsmA family protein [Shewanella psychropiezotolerans]|uniref:AsmA family protein n=1 Tax=Shewanella psychropiezotolerans TaxID=2593655 RepID=A0ABX5WZ74_9GAMM|nr:MULTISPECIES: AsmA family protein [Shewanella]MPY24161.1 AsmA family protein [Shewanella sp. YLB-07]QDO84390.1 AsmA family protein [Shewanella psychropiezotolerans]